MLLKDEPRGTRKQDPVDLDHVPCTRVQHRKVSKFKRKKNHETTRGGEHKKKKKRKNCARNRKMNRDTSPARVMPGSGREEREKTLHRDGRLEFFPERQLSSGGKKTLPGKLWEGVGGVAYCALGDYLNCTEKWEMTSPANQRGMERSSGGTM